MATKCLNEFMSALMFLILYLNITHVKSGKISYTMFKQKQQPYDLHATKLNDKTPNRPDFTKSYLKSFTLNSCIFSGYCVEFDPFENKIVSNYNKSCTSFHEKPCPQIFYSTENYKCMFSTKGCNTCYEYEFL